MGHAACLPLAHRKPDRADETGGLTVALTWAAEVRLPLRNALGMKRVLRRSVNWSGKRDLNPRPSPWQGDALPLSYSRIHRPKKRDSTGHA